MSAMKYSRMKAHWSGPLSAATLCAITSLAPHSSFGMSVPDKHVDTNGSKQGLGFPWALPGATLRGGAYISEQ